MIINGSCLDVMKTMADNSVDAIVTDPPYELGFMGKSWDSTGIANNVELWKECLRVLKPGGHLLAFSGTRTYHRMASAIEDAGFEVRDMIEWVYGSGFPKSLNIGKAVDKRPNILMAGKMRDELNKYRIRSKLSVKQVNIHFGFAITGSGVAHHWMVHPTQPTIPTQEQYQELKKLLNIDDPKLDEIYIEAERELLGKDKNWGKKGDVPVSGYGEWDITKGTSEWEGWGTALKPAHEPICMARKPLSEKTVAENCLKWGIGGINIDESRVEFGDETDSRIGTDALAGGSKESIFGGYSNIKDKNIQMYKGNGRFPANLIHDNSEEVRECFPNESERFFKSIIYQAKASKSERNKGLEEFEEKENMRVNAPRLDEESKHSNMMNNHHPTVKPISLMRYLAKMVTPKDGTVLDPFNGSGSTGIACKLENFNYIGIELDPEYCKISEARIAGWEIEPEERQLCLI